MFHARELHVLRALSGVALGVVSPVVARAQMKEMVPLEEDLSKGAGDTGAKAAGAPVILEEFSVDERTVVISAARTRTTIQEAPGIITVITADEIRARGHRTVNDVLRSVPGFEGARYESNGWFEEAVARGQPRTLLILVNGVNVTEPLRNAITLDRKLPIEAIKRIEVTSGPGGVLWGSNALLGVVNIILKDHRDLDGVELIAGGGHGPGAQAAFKGAAAYGGSLLDGKLKLFGTMSVYSDRGAELEVDAAKILGALPAPEPDSAALMLDEKRVSDFNGRDYFVSTAGNALFFDQLTLDWWIELERDRRQIATGGALLRGTRKNEAGELVRATAETEAKDSVMMVGLNWRDRFMEDRFGISAKAYGARWVEDQDPFWAFPPTYISDQITALEDGVVIALKVKRMYRIGANVDAATE